MARTEYNVWGVTPCPFLYLREIFSFSPVSVILAVGFFTDVLHQVEKYLSGMCI